MMQNEVKGLTDAEKRERHRIAALKWAHKNAEYIRVYSINRYHARREELNAKRRERYAAKKAAQQVVIKAEPETLRKDENNSTETVI